MGLVISYTDSAGNTHPEAYVRLSSVSFNTLYRNGSVVIEKIAEAIPGKVASVTAQDPDDSFDVTLFGSSYPAGTPQNETIVANGTSTINGALKWSALDKCQIVFPGPKKSVIIETDNRTIFAGERFQPGRSRSPVVVSFEIYTSHSARLALGAIIGREILRIERNDWSFSADPEIEAWRQLKELQIYSNGLDL